MARLSIGLILALIIAIFLGLVGWVMNLVALVTTDFASYSAEFVLRVLGIPIPILGAFMGWFA